MARGRLISKNIIIDRTVNMLSDDTSRLGFTWLITLTDCEGRTVGEPDLLKAALFPRRSDITPEIMEQYIIEWANAGFIVWYYGGDGDRYIQFKNFTKYQPGLRKEREGQSNIPGPEEVRSYSAVTPAIPGELQEKCGLSQVNLSQYNLTEIEQEKFTELKNAFVDESGIPEFTGNMQAWVDNLIKFVRASLMEIDIREGIRYNRSHNLPVLSPQSIAVSAVAAMADRKAGVSRKARTKKMHNEDTGLDEEVTIG